MTIEITMGTTATCLAISTTMAEAVGHQAATTTTEMAAMAEKLDQEPASSVVPRGIMPIRSAPRVIN